MNNGNSICINQDIEKCTYKINYKSKIVVGNVTIMLEKKFNWFNKLMFKLVFGIKIENIKEIK